MVRDGEDMSLLHTHRLQNSTVAPKDLWVTDMVLLHNLNKVTSTLIRTHDKRLISCSAGWCHDDESRSIVYIQPIIWSVYTTN